MTLIFTVIVVFMLLLIGELWWRHQGVHGEFSRKFVHLSVGSFVAFWPFFLSWRQIQILSIAFLIVVAVSKYLDIFQAIHSVQRPTWGELYFAAAVGLVTLVTTSKWVYAAALLQMSLADGLAAVAGTRYGTRHNKYTVFGHTKSVIGTITFIMVSLLILLTLNQHNGALGVPTLVGISLVASLIENLGVKGMDNLLVPLFVAILIR